MTIKKRFEIYNDPDNWDVVEQSDRVVDHRIIRLRHTNIYRFQYYILNYFDGWVTIGEYQLVEGNLRKLATKQMVSNALKRCLP